MPLEATAMSLTSIHPSSPIDTIDTPFPVSSLDDLSQPPQGSFLPPRDSVMVSPTPRVIIRSHWFERSLALNHRREWMIGRGKDSHIILPDRSISRHHAALKYVDSVGFTLVDLGSLNGCFVNEQQVMQSILLKSGDRILLGETELYFQCPSTDFQFDSPESQGKNVLITSSSHIQGEIWREILSSQGLSITWAVSTVTLEEVLLILDRLGQFPSLLLLDLGATKNNPYEFCRWCRQTQPNLPVILTSGMRTELYPSERQWALRQGALDLFPGFNRSNLLSNLGEIATKVRTILQALDWQQIEQSSLVPTLLELQERVRLDNPPASTAGS